jgi:hypothetical protein
MCEDREGNECELVEFIVRVSEALLRQRERDVATEHGTICLQRLFHSQSYLISSSRHLWQARYPTAWHSPRGREYIVRVLLYCAPNWFVRI